MIIEIDEDSVEIEDDKEETFEYGKDGKVQNDNLLNYYKYNIMLIRQYTPFFFW